MTLSTTLPANKGTYPMTLTVTLPAYPMVAAVTKQFTLEIICEVFSIVKTTIPVASASYKIGIDGPLIFPF